MKKILRFLTVSLCVFLLTSCSQAQTNSTDSIISDENITVMQADSVFTQKDIIDAFHITDTTYFSKGTPFPSFNSTEPRPFGYLDGTLLTYIFENPTDCDLGLQEAKQSSVLLTFCPQDTTPLIYTANNALLIYLPDYSIQSKITSRMEWLLFLKKAAEQKGLTPEMVSGLSNLGYSTQEILDLPQEKIDQIFAPGTQLDGYGFDFSALTQEQQRTLKGLGIDAGQSVILNNLGYTYEDMTQISPQELDLIFPNTELLAKLATLGVSQNNIETKIRDGSSYKDIIKQALNLCE